MRVSGSISLYLLGLTSFGLSTSAEAAPAVVSPSAKTDLICPNSVLADCYPKIFQPTEQFQIIKEGQDLPPGLHVRLNIYTGLKEARLNVPSEGEGELNPNLPDVHDSSIVLVPQPEAEEKKNSPPAMRDRVPRKPPVYESAGKIQAPIPNTPDNHDDASSYASAMSVLTSNSEDIGALTDSLTTLTDLAHDIYYGVEIVKNPQALEKLFTTMFASKNATDQKLAANIIGHCVQNNPTALKDLLFSWDSTDIDQSLGSALYHVVKAQSDAIVTKAKIYALSGLLKNHTVRDTWLREGGMDVSLDMLTAPVDLVDWDRTFVKLVEFVTDTFLDEDMGAESGIWPQRTVPRQPEQCARDAAGRGMDGDCWRDASRGLLESSATTNSNFRETFDRFDEALRIATGGAKVSLEKQEL